MANLRVDKITSTETFETTGSVQFDSSGDYLDLGTSSDFTASGDFTVEGWVYHKTGSGITQLFGLGDYKLSSGFVIYVNANRRLSFYTNNQQLDSDTYVDDKTWSHLAVVRSGSKISLYLNGSRYISYTGYSSEFSGRVLIGSAVYNGNPLSSSHGNLSNVRYVVGTALYTSNFKPSMRELEVIPGTVVLACQSKTDASLEKTGRTITVNGNAVANELTPGLLTPVPKAGAGSAITGSVEFDGTGDYLTLANSSDFNFGTGDFTVECFIHVNKHLAGATDVIVSTYQDSSNGWTLGIHGHSPADKFYFAIAGDSSQLSSSVLYTDSWVHLAASRSGSTAKLFINGVEAASASNSTNQTSTSDLHIGTNVGGGSLSTEGFISNLRVVKGTALYTDDFIPPTRELKKVPGTVLLCCQDPDNPLTEATGKTITPYGNLGRTPGEYITFNRTFDSNIDDWEGYNSTPSYDTGRLKINASTQFDGAQTENAVTVQPNRKYILRVTVELGTAGGVRIQPRVSDNSTPLATLDVTADGIYEVPFNSNAETGVHIRLITSGGNTGTAFFDDVSITNATEDKAASNFTPQVGDDRKVTFEGVTKINSDAYFYLPTGDTVTRDTRSGRGIFGGGQVGPTRVNSIGFITITTQGNSQDFGDLTVVRSDVDACSSSTRGIFGGGRNPSLDPSRLNVMDFVTMASTGNALDFGDLSVQRRYPGSCSNSTRGVFAGGSNPTSSNLNSIDFVTIASTGDATDFGDLITERAKHKGCGSSIRAILFSPEPGEDIQFFNYASTGRATSFGEMTPDTKGDSGAASDSTRALRFGGFTHPAGDIGNNISYITISSTGNEQEFGDLSSTGSLRGTAMSNSIRAVQILNNNGSNVNHMEYVTIQTTGNGKDFGDLTVANFNFGGSTSDSHGGLG